MPTPEEIVKSLAEDGWEVREDTLLVRGSQPYDNCGICSHLFHQSESLLVGWKQEWMLLACLDRPACRQRRDARKAERIKGLAVVKL